MYWTNYTAIRASTQARPISVNVKSSPSDLSTHKSPATAKSLCSSSLVLRTGSRSLRMSVLDKSG